MDTGPATSIDRQLAILREQQALQQALTHLNTTEQQLLFQQAQLHQQINLHSAQAYQAQQLGQHDQAARALEQRAAAMTAYASLQEQLQRVAARKAEINRRQQYLQAQLNVLLSAQHQADSQLRGMLNQLSAPPRAPVPPSTKPRAAHKWLLWLSVLVAVGIVAASLAITGQLKQFASSQATPGHQTTPTPGPLSANNSPFYLPASGAPSTQTCMRDFGQPCYSPENIQQAFRLNPLYRSGYTGAGQTIVLLGAGHTTTLQADLHYFDQTWGLPDPALTIVQPHGPPAPYACPGGRDELEGENILDVEWAHAIAPGAKIVLVIGDNGGGSTPQENCTGDSTLAGDTAYAINHHLGQVISMSYGGSELGLITNTPADQTAEQRYYQDSHTTFKQAADQHITVLASAGDDGATNHDDPSNANAYWNRPNVSWPASDPDVLAVGGTKLTLNASGSYKSETVWNEAGFGATGGGLSTIFAEPAYQKTVPDQALFHGKRGLPDVAFPADNFLIYDAPSPGVLNQINPRWQHWDIVGGTSVSAPSWAGLIAIANQMRGQPIGLIQPALYSLHGKGMHDITTGSNSFHQVTGYQAQQGFDLASGWGTPIADQFIPALVQAANQT
jgi:subtilase family serine protease